MSYAVEGLIARSMATQRNSGSIEMQDFSAKAPSSATVTQRTETAAKGFFQTILDLIIGTENTKAIRQDKMNAFSISFENAAGPFG